MKLISLFSGCGGLDLGFHNAGFDISWANEFDKEIFPTLKYNFPKTEISTSRIEDVDPCSVPECDGIIGGPPCQSWSSAGSLKGIDDPRGQLIFQYLKFLKVKKPKFFLAENVSGLLHKRNEKAFQKIIRKFELQGYEVAYHLLNSYDYGVPQSRKRVFIIGYRKDIGKSFVPPEPVDNKINLKDVIWDLRNSAVPSKPKNKANSNLKIANHEFFTGKFSFIYMSRNRVRSWQEPSYTIQASGRHAPCHPNAPKMKKIDKDIYEFKKGYKRNYRRLSVRECADIQTFPRNFKFKYEYLSSGYKMIGNAVPVNLACEIANKIKKDLN